MTEKKDGAIPVRSNELLCTEFYLLKCLNCHSKIDLTMVAHRVDGFLVGWIFVCRNCFPIVAGKQLILNGA